MQVIGHDVSAADTNSPRFAWLVGLAACIVLFVPLYVANVYYAQPAGLQIDSTAEVVGIGVILRAMLRRLLRSGARSVLQTSVGTVTRASSRTMTRRVVRVGVRSLTAVFARSSEVTIRELSEPENVPDAPSQSTAYALATGFVALALSLIGVYLVLGAAQHASEDSDAALLGGMPLLLAAVLAAIPLLVYAALLLSAASVIGANVRFRTGWESLILQAYFTGGGSFLPLSTDSEIEGSQPARLRLALTSLGGLLLLHWALAGAAHYLDLYTLQYLGGMFLLYCFVFSFPIAPLDGYYLWKTSPWLWLAVWIPILASFILNMPESLHVIL